MAVFSIPCETFVRLASVLRIMPDNASVWFNSVRIDNGVAVASNRRLIVCEEIGGPSGVVHIVADPTLIAQCATEAPYGSKLTVSVVEAVGYATAQTTLGYTFPGNAMVVATVPNEFDAWRSKIPDAPATASKGSQFWDTDIIGLIAASSPSGKIVFEEFIDTSRPSIINDVNDHRWCGFVNFNDFPNRFAPARRHKWLDA